MSNYKPGDRLHVTFDVTVLPNGAWQTTYHYIGKPMQESVVSVEKLEPEWRPGDVVRAADGRAYSREIHACRGAVWWQLGTDYAADPIRWDKDVPRPLTPLVRDGKPWGEA